MSGIDVVADDTGLAAVTDGDGDLAGDEAGSVVLPPQAVSARARSMLARMAIRIVDSFHVHVSSGRC
jgi:hypothetical protein